MKVFWSWQSDTPGKVGRHFVREAIEEAVASLKQGDQIEEPSEREVREALHLDHDRKGVSGTPDLANTIFDKIRSAAVFVADVTLVGESVFSEGKSGEKSKKLINSNVAIEYGFARQCVSDGRILLVQNVFYGDREELPFDLRHKAGPIQFRIGPDATKPEITRERERLKAELFIALRACLQSVVVQKTEFRETAATTRPAYFWNPGETLAVFETGFTRGLPEDEPVHYSFNEPRAFYLRLIPTSPLPDELPNTKLLAIGKSGQVGVLSRGAGASSASINSYGVAVYEAFGSSAAPTAITQLFRNGEIWGVSKEMIIIHYGELALPALNLRNIFAKSLSNFEAIASTHLGVLPPYKVALGAVGLRGVRLTFPKRRFDQDLTKEIHADECRVERVAEITQETIHLLVTEFVRRLYDLVGIDYAEE